MRTIWPSAENVCRSLLWREGGRRSRPDSGGEVWRPSSPGWRVRATTWCISVSLSFPRYFIFFTVDIYTKILIQIHIDLGFKRVLGGQPGNLATTHVNSVKRTCSSSKQTPRK